MINTTSMEEAMEQQPREEGGADARKGPPGSAAPSHAEDGSGGRSAPEWRLLARIGPRLRCAASATLPCGGPCRCSMMTCLGDSGAIASRYSCGCSAFMVAGNVPVSSASDLTQVGSRQLLKFSSCGLDAVCVVLETERVCRLRFTSRHRHHQGAPSVVLVR